MSEEEIDQIEDPSDDDIALQAYNNLREAAEALLSLVMGMPLGVAEWVLVAVPTAKHEEGHQISLEPRIVTELFQAEWKSKGLIHDALNGFQKSEMVDLVLDVLDGDDD